jgi:hypothetical protein
MELLFTFGRFLKGELKCCQRGVVLILDIFAIVSVLLGSSEVKRKLLWIVVILLLPVVGMVLYFLIGRSSSDA